MTEPRQAVGDGRRTERDCDVEEGALDVVEVVSGVGLVEMMLAIGLLLEPAMEGDTSEDDAAVVETTRVADDVVGEGPTASALEVAPWVKEYKSCTPYPPQNSV